MSHREAAAGKKREHNGRAYRCSPSLGMEMPPVKFLQVLPKLVEFHYAHKNAAAEVGETISPHQPGPAVPTAGDVVAPWRASIRENCMLARSASHAKISSEHWVPTVASCRPSKPAARALGV